jgi:hypothetical protein
VLYTFYPPEPATPWLAAWPAPRCPGNGKSVKTSFPEGLIAQIGQGAELGRCEFLD